MHDKYIQNAFPLVEVSIMEAMECDDKYAHSIALVFGVSCSFELVLVFVFWI